MKMDHNDGGNEGTDLDVSGKAYNEIHNSLEDMDEDGVIMVEGSRYYVKAYENVQLCDIADSVGKVRRPRKRGLGGIASQAPLDILDVEETSYPNTDSQDAAAVSAEGTTADEAHDEFSFHVSELLDSDALPGSLEKQESLEVADEDASYHISELLDSDPVAISVSLAEDATLNISIDDTFNSENSPALDKDALSRRMWRAPPKQGVMGSTSGPAIEVGSGQHRASPHEELEMESALDDDDVIEEGGRTSEEESDLPYDGDLDEGSDLYLNSASNTSGTGKGCANFSALHEKRELAEGRREQPAHLTNLALEDDAGDREEQDTQLLSRDVNSGLRNSLVDEMGTRQALVTEEEHLLSSTDDVLRSSNYFNGKYLSDTINTVEHSLEACYNTSNVEDEIVCLGSANEPQNTVCLDQEMQYKANEHVLGSAEEQYTHPPFHQQLCDMLHNREQEGNLEIRNDGNDPMAQNSKATMQYVSHAFGDEELSSRHYIEAETMPEISFTESVDAVTAKPADFLNKVEFNRSHNESSMQIIPEHDQWLSCTDEGAQNPLVIDRENFEMDKNVNNSMDMCNAAEPSSHQSCINNQTLTVLKSDDCVANAPCNRSTLLGENQKPVKGQVHYPLPKLSTVEPKIRSKRKGNTKVDRAPSSTKVSVKLSRSASHKPLVATVREVLYSPELPMVSCKTRCVTPEPQEGSPAVQSDNRSPNSKISADMVRQLQEDYDKLLTKYAEAENTIDHLRLGAKVSLFADAPKPASSSIHMGTLHTPSRPVTLTIPKPQQAWLIQPDVGSQDHPDGGSRGAGYAAHAEEATPGMRLTQEMASQALCFRDKINAFQVLLNSGKLSLENQQEALEQLRRDQDGLERRYMSRKEEHRGLQLQTNRGGTAFAGHFDPHREVEGVIFHLGMSLEGIKERVDESRRRPLSPDATPASPPLSATAVQTQRVPSSHPESPLSVVIHQHITLDLVEGSETDNETGRESVEERVGDQESSRSETQTERGESDKEGGDTMEEDRGSTRSEDSSGLSSTQSYRRGSQATGRAVPRQHRSVAAPAGRHRRERALHLDTWAQGKTNDRSESSTAPAKEDLKKNTCLSREMDGWEEDELFGGSGRRAPTPQPHMPLQPSQQPPLPVNVVFNSVEAPSLFPDHRHQRDTQPKEQPNQNTTEAGGISRHVSHISLASSGISVQGSCDNFQRFRHSVKEERVISPETDSGFVGSENGRITGRTSSLAESLRLTARSSSSHPSLPEECESDAPAVAPPPAARQRVVWSDAEGGEAPGSHATHTARRPCASSGRWDASTTSDWDLRGCRGRDRLDDSEREDGYSLDGFSCRPLKRAELNGLDGEHPRGPTTWSRSPNGLQGEDGVSPPQRWDGAHGEDRAAEEGSVLRSAGEDEVDAREPGVAHRPNRAPSADGDYPDLSRLSVGPKRRSKHAARSGVESIPRSEPWAPRLHSSRATLSLADLQHCDEDEEAGRPTASPPWATPPRRSATRGHHSRNHLPTGPHSGADYKNFPPGRLSGKSVVSDDPCSGCSAKARVSERHWDSGTKVVPCLVCNGSGLCKESKRSSHHEDDLLLEDLRDETVRSPQSMRRQRSKTLPGLYSVPYVYPALYSLPSALYVSPYYSRFYLPETPPRNQERPSGFSPGRAHEDIGMRSEREFCMSLDLAIRTAEGMRRTSQRMVESLSRDIAHVHATHQFLFR